MDVNLGQENIAERLANLLEESPIDEKLKHDIVESIDRMPMHHLVQIMEFLTNQNKELSSLEADLDDMVRQHQAQWRALEKKQEATAMSIVDDAIAEAEEEVRLQEDLQSADEA